MQERTFCDWATFIREASRRLSVIAVLNKISTTIMHILYLLIIIDCYNSPNGLFEIQVKLPKIGY